MFCPVYFCPHWGCNRTGLSADWCRYTTDLSLGWDRNPGTVGFLVPDDVSAIHCDAHAKRPPCTGWERTGTGTPLPIRVVYLVDGHANYPQPPSFISKPRRSYPRVAGN